jgi:hypothetical protein
VSSLQVTVWSERDSPRLRYVLDWLLTERLGLSYQLTLVKAEALKAQHALAYGWLQEVPGIHRATSLLWEDRIQPHEIVCEEWQGLYTLYFNEGSRCDIQFDMFAGIFYLLSRYEEYLPFEPDQHNRFPAPHSILYPVLERPVLDEWVEALRIFLEQVWNISIPQKPFSFQPTYDIDIAWSYKYKGWKRTIGAVLKDAIKSDWTRLNHRLRVWRGGEEDPYNSFVFLFGLHMMDVVRPVYFVLSALQASIFDKNISPIHPRMASLIKALANGSVLGLHPSYYSDVRPQLLIEEKAILEHITHQPITVSRQHFMKLRFPETYRSLVAAGIEEDFSMGYSTIFGFRAGTSHPFLWYDLKDEYCSSLRLHPFAFMDSTGHYDLGLSAEDSFKRLRQMAAKLQACGGRLITIMHNYSLGTDDEWKGWRKEYERFLQDVKKTG